MTEQLIAKWDAYYQDTDSECFPTQLLRQHMYMLPKEGTALDLACGLGANAILMAEAGLNVDAWDISGVAIKKLQQKADMQGFLPIECRQINIHAGCFPQNHYDVIVVSRFFDRSLSNAIISALRPGGLLFYQTYTRQKLDPDGPKNPEFLLMRNELLGLFKALSVVYYQEFALTGNLLFANRNEAMLIAQKPEVELNS